MKQQLDELNQQAMRLITEYAGKNDPATIAAIAASANRIRQMSDQLDTIEHEIPQLKETLRQYSHPHTAPIVPPPTRVNGKSKASRKGIRIEIDWSRKGKEGGKEVINEYMASDCLTKFITRLHQELGEEVLPTLGKVRVNRGPLVSDDPQSDFKNHADGTIYQNQPVPNTDYHVLTHSNTSQKVGDIQKACRSLGLPIGMVTVIEVEK